MDKYTFMDLFIEKLLRKLGRNCQIELRDTLKNSGEMQEEILIKRKNTAILSIYSLDSCYEQYKAGKAVETLAREIAEEYKYCQKHFIFPEPEVLRDFDKIKERIFVRLMNRKANREYLKNKVYSTFLDLAAVYYIDLRKDVHFQAEYAGTAIIREIFREWNIPISVLHVKALENMKKRGGYKLQKLDELLNNAGCHLEYSEDDKLWILKLENEYNCGSTALLYPSLLKKAAEVMQGNFYVLPSSIYEVLLYPEDSELTEEEIEEGVKEANHTSVKEEEFLSNHIYYYDVGKKTLTMVI